MQANPRERVLKGIMPANSRSGRNCCCEKDLFHKPDLNGFRLWNWKHWSREPSNAERPPPMLGPLQWFWSLPSNDFSQTLQRPSRMLQFLIFTNGFRSVMRNFHLQWPDLIMIRKELVSCDEKPQWKFGGYWFGGNAWKKIDISNMVLIRTVSTSKDLFLSGWSWKVQIGVTKNPSVIDQRKASKEPKIFKMQLILLKDYLKIILSK